MYFSLFGAPDHDITNNTDNASLMIWLQGGPGSSSQFSAFSEIGPIRIQNGTPKLHSHPWSIMAHLLFIDSPLNTGFSYHGDRHGKLQVDSSETISNHLINFLYHFYIDFPTLKHCKVYLAGDGFAGHFLPHLVMKTQNQTFINSTGFKLTGVSIGSGWVDPINQLNYFDSYLWSVGIIENRFREVCTWYQTNAIVNIYDGKFSTATDYVNFIINNRTTLEKFMGNVSLHNFRNYSGIDRSFVGFLNANKRSFGV
jgi:carboxypeptidase C (cathepsin A)